MGSITNYSFYPFLLRQFKVKEHFSPILAGEVLGQSGQSTFFTPFCWVRFEANYIFYPFWLGQSGGKSHFNPFWLGQLCRSRRSEYRGPRPE